MEVLKIKSVDGASSFTLMDREPFDTDEAIDHFTVRITSANLDATARVYAYRCQGLPDLFTEVAHNWNEFSGPRNWSSLEGEFSVAITHDGLGHFIIDIELKSSPYPGNWLVKSSAKVETSQLERLASNITEFIGHHE